MTLRRACATALVAALLVHLAAVAGEFVYDDHRFVEENPAVREVGNPLRFFTDLSTTADPGAATTDVYRPLRTLSYAVSVSLFGPTPLPLHLLALALHAATAVFLVRLLAEAGLAPWPALGASLLFALHPVTVESTAWISSLGDVGCGCFSLLATLFFARGRPVAALLALLPALLWKEHAIAVPVLWAVWDVAREPGRLKRDALRAILPGALLAGGFLAWRFHLTGAFAQTPQPLGGSAANAVWTMLAGLGFYAACVVWPSGPTFDARIEIQTGPSAAVAAGVAVLALLAFGVLRGPRRVRLGCLWFLVALAPVGNILVPLKIATADRFLYLPLAGLAFAAGEALARLEWRRVAVRAAPAALALLAAVTIVRIGDWRDDDALIDARDRTDPKSLAGLWAKADRGARRMEAALGLGDLQAARRELEEAGAYYDRYLRNAEPAQSVQVHLRFGRILETWGRDAARRVRQREAVEFYTRALEHYRAAHNLHRLGQGRRVEAEVVAAATGIARLCVQLAVPENPELPRVCRTGLDAAKFLESEFGRDETLRVSQLLLALGVYTAPGLPAKAREMLEAALDGFRRSGEPPYEVAQTLYHLASLLDAEPDRPQLERARDLFVESARRAPGMSDLAFLGAARCERRIAERFGDDAARESARNFLVEAERSARSPGVAREIEEEKARWASGG